MVQWVNASASEQEVVGSNPTKSKRSWSPGVPAGEKPSAVHFGSGAISFNKKFGLNGKKKLKCKKGVLI